MATSNILGLFMSPDEYQAQQLASEQQRAVNFANLTPMQLANYNMFLGGQQLGRGLAGVFGVQDPQLQRIRQRQEIMQTINPADLESLKTGIQRASQMGDQELALTLADFWNKQSSERALAEQRMAEAKRASPGIQEAARIAKITEDLQKLDPKKEEDKPRYEALVAERTRLERQLRRTSGDKVQELKDLYIDLEEAQKRVANRAAPSTMVGLDGQAFATRPQVNVENDPEVRAIQSLIRVATGEKPAKEVAAPEAVRTAEAYADSVSDDRKSKEWKDAYQSQLKKNDGKDKVSELRDLREQRIRAVAAGDTVEIGIIDRLINAIAPEKGGVDKDILKAERIGELTEELETLARETGKDTQLYRRKAAILEALKGGDKTPAPIKEQVLAGEIIKLNKFIRDAKDPNAPDVIDAITQVELYRDAMKRDKPNLDVVGIAKEGTYAGTAVFLDETARKTFVFGQDKDGKQIEVPYTGAYTKLKGGTEVNVGGAEVKVDTGEAGKAAGKKLGAELVDVKDKQSAIDSIDNALGLLNQGIYAGGYGPAQNFVAKYTGIGDKNKVARTEQFLAFIGDVVVPRLKEFGGNDSEQELAYLNRIMGGQIEMEPIALKNILKQAKIKINQGIERLRRQVESGEKKESLTTTLPPAADGAQTPAPKPTMRYNPATKKLERIK